MAETSIVVKLIDETQRGFRDINGRFDDLDKSGNRLSRTMDQVKQAAAGFLFALSGRELLEFIDSVQTMDNRLKLVTNSSSELNKRFNQLFDISQRTRTPLEENVDLYSKLAQNQAVVGKTGEEITQVVEAFNLAMTISGTSGNAAAGAITQFAQAMQSGKLQGDEFRSMAEAVPKIMQVLSERTGIAREDLKRLASEGFLDAKIVAQALTDALPDLQQELGRTSTTVGQAITQMSNEFTRLGRDFLESSGLADFFVRSIEHIIENSENLISMLKVAAAGIAVLTAAYAPAVAIFTAVAAAVVYFADVLGPLLTPFVKIAEQAIGELVKGLVGFGAAIKALMKLENPFDAFSKATSEYEERARKSAQTTSSLSDNIKGLNSSQKDNNDVTKQGAPISDQMNKLLKERNDKILAAKDAYGPFIERLKEEVELSKLDSKEKEIQKTVYQALAAEAKKYGGDMTQVSEQRRKEITAEVTALMLQKQENDRIREETLAAEKAAAEYRKKLHNEALGRLKTFADEQRKFEDSQLTNTERYIKDRQQIEDDYNRARTSGVKMSTDEIMKLEEDYEKALMSIRTRIIKDDVEANKKWREGQKSEHEKFRDEILAIDERFQLAQMSGTQEHLDSLNRARDAYLKTETDANKRWREENMTANEKYQKDIEEVNTKYRNADRLGTQEHLDSLRRIQDQHTKDIRNVIDKYRDENLTAEQSYRKKLEEFANNLAAQERLTEEEKYLYLKKLREDYVNETVKAYDHTYNKLGEYLGKKLGISKSKWGEITEVARLFGVDTDAILKDTFATGIQYLTGFTNPGGQKIDSLGSLIGTVFGANGNARQSVIGFGTTGTTAITGFGQTGNQVLTQFGQQIPGYFGPLTTSMPQIFSTQGFGITNLISAGAQAFRGFSSTILDIFSNIGGSLKGIFGNILNIISSGAGSIVDGISSVISSISGGGGGGGSNILGSIGNIVSSVTGGGGGSATGFGGWEKVVSGGLGKVMDWGQQGLSYVSSIASSGLSYLGSIGSSILSAGSAALSGIGSFLSSGLSSVIGFLSDSRMKRDVSYLGTMSSGLNAYSFNYKNPHLYGGGRKTGVMAQEVQQLYPNAVTDMGGGALGVNYGMLPRASMIEPQTMSGTGSSDVNISFTINAVDGASVESMLIDKRQFITNMVRSAVYEKGRSLI